MKRIACAFCPNLIPVGSGSFAAGNEGEHIWPSWVDRGFRKAGISPQEYRLHTMQGGKLIAKKKRAINYKQPVVCEDCNNNWMSVLEQGARDLLLRSVTAGSPFVASGADQELLALWAVKNAVVFDQTHLVSEERAKPFYSPRERFAMHDQHRVPNHMLVTMFMNAGESFTYGRATYSGASPNVRDKQLKNREVYAATLAYGKVGFQIVKFKFQNPKKGTGSPVVSEPSGWADWSERLWPATGQAVWPPNRGLSFKAIWEYAHRWVDHTPPMPEPYLRRR